MKVEITESASDDIAEGFDFYEGQQTGLGSYFESSVIVDLRSLATIAGIHETRFDFFRMVAHNFPFSIYYKVEGEVVSVFAVIDNRRDPNWISERLK